jgi:N-acetyl-S-(2-succino)cysteine monooxygenase
MSKNNRKMNLNLFLNSLGHHEAAWRYPESPAEDILNFSYYKKVAQKAEQAKLDAIFLADRVSISPQSVEHGSQVSFEPLTLLSALSAVTENIGLIGTVSTSFNEPFNLARRFSSIDFLSNGRVGWNIITSGTDREAQNFNLDAIPNHSERYKRAEEFLEVTLKLWDSWEEDALIISKEDGIFANSEKVHEINHNGQFYKVRGPLNISSSPQKRPVLVLASASEDGKEVAAKYAEAIFTAHQTFHNAKEFYQDVKSRVIKYGRDSEKVKILPGICLIVGETEEEVKERELELERLINFDHSLIQLSNRVGVDLTSAPLDEPLPELPDIQSIQGHQSRTQLIVELAKRENLTLRQLLLRLGGGRGHYTFSGTPQKIADELEYWFLNGAADGFNIMPQVMKHDLDQFINLVIPELQRRGLFRTEYEGKTLREHYGLGLPKNQFITI